MLAIFQAFWQRLCPKKHYEIVGHFDKQGSTYVIWRNSQGISFTDKVENLVNMRAFLLRLSTKDAFLLGYLLGTVHEKMH